MKTQSKQQTDINRLKKSQATIHCIVPVDTLVLTHFRVGFINDATNLVHQRLLDVLFNDVDSNDLLKVENHVPAQRKKATAEGLNAS